MFCVSQCGNRYMHIHCFFFCWCFFFKEANKTLGWCSRLRGKYLPYHHHPSATVIRLFATHAFMNLRIISFNVETMTIMHK